MVSPSMSSNAEVRVTTTLPPSLLRTLPGHYYTDTAIFEIEQAKIFESTWFCVARADDVAKPGQFRSARVGRESVLVVRGRDNSIRAFLNVCRHRGARLCTEESGEVKRVFQCPYHAWTYDLDGRLIGTPNVQENELFDRSSYPLHPVAVDEYAGFVFVNLADRPRPLMESLTQGTESMTAFERFAMQDLRIGVRIVYEVEANWKIIVENYNECLHCPTVHPELVKVVPLFRFGEVWDDEMRDGGNAMVEGATSFTIEGRSELPTLPGLLPEDLGRYYGSYQFPNLMLNLHPDCVMYYLGYPRGPSHTTVVSEYLFPPEVIADPERFKPRPVVELWDLISKQDWDVCERAQTGVGSRAFTTGVYPRQDRFLYSFNEDYRVRMGREPLG